MSRFFPNFPILAIFLSPFLNYNSFESISFEKLDVSEFTFFFFALISEDTVLIQSIPCRLQHNIRHNFLFIYSSFQKLR